MKKVEIIRDEGWNGVPHGKIITVHDHIADALCEGEDPAAVPYVPLDSMTVEELRGALRERDLKVSGTKDELVARLQGVK